MSRVKIKDIAKEISERIDDPKNSGIEIFVGLEHYDSGCVRITRFGSTKNLDSSVKKFKTGDILIARRNVYLKRAGIVDFDGVTSGDSIVIRANDESNRKLLPFIFNSEDFWNYAAKHADGSMSKRLSPKTLMEYEIELPTIEKQKELIKVLWSINETIKNTRELFKQSDNIVKSRFIEMFGSPIKSKKWGIKPLNEVCDVRDGTHDSPKFYSDGYPFITSKNITNGNIDFSKCQLISRSDYLHFNDRSKVDNGDILMPMIGTIGGAVIVKKDRDFAIKNVALIKFTKTNINNSFVKYVLNSDEMNEYFNGLKKGGTQQFISLSNIRNIPIIVPPIELQNEFASFVKQIDKSKISLQKKIDSLELIIKNVCKSLLFGGNLYVKK